MNRQIVFSNDKAEEVTKAFQLLQTLDIVDKDANLSLDDNNDTGISSGILEWNLRPKELQVYDVSEWEVFKDKHLTKTKPLSRGHKNEHKKLEKEIDELKKTVKTLKQGITDIMDYLNVKPETKWVEADGDNYHLQHKLVRKNNDKISKMRSLDYNSLNGITE